jgi:hypothetical protein
LELRRKGMISWHDWLRSVRRTDLFPYLRWRDPVPSIVNIMQRSKSLPRLWSRKLPEALSPISGGANGADRGALSRRDGASAL